MFSILFFILPGRVVSLNWEYIVFEESWKTLSSFGKVFIEKMIIRIPMQGVCVVFLARSSHQSLRSYTISITAPSKEKARTFMCFLFIDVIFY